MNPRVGVGSAKRSARAAGAWYPGPKRVVEGEADQEGGQHARHVSGKSTLRDHGVENDAEAHEADDGHAQQLDDGNEADQHEGDAGDGSEQARARDHAAHPVPGKRKDKLEEAHHHHGRHSQVPRRHRRVVLIETALLEGGEGRSQHQEGEADRRRRVDPERHGRHVVASRPAREPHRHPCVDQVAHEHAEGGPGKHARVDDVGGKLEQAHEHGREKGHHREVIDNEPEETVQVARQGPAAVGGCAAHSRRRNPNSPTRQRQSAAAFSFLRRPGAP